MTLTELGKKLNKMYNDAPRGEQVTMIHLFGVRYHQEIEDFGIKQVIKQADIKQSYQTELAKAVKLAEYVVIKNKYELWMPG